MPRNESETRAELIDPALKDAGWAVVQGSRVAREEVITIGALEGTTPDRRGKRDIADYVLVYKNHKLAVIEAKAEGKPVTEGLGQAKKYARRLNARFAFSTNGAGLYCADMETGDEGPVDAYPSPEQLWNETFAEANAWRDRFAEIPFEDKSGSWQPRYYQHNAINHVLEAIASGDKRILLTMATGTGKTAVAFQIAWKLFHSRWSLLGEPTRRPRILFLADRNILANQAFNAFSAFPDDAMIRIDPDAIRKNDRVPKNGSIFFTIFQTFMTGSEEPRFGDYPPDFFDFIIIDECHRGGANDESTWRGILEYFEPAVQLGLTATPKREHNADTYDYFGEPVYVYSLKEGINDGFLTPFRVKKISTTLDEYTYTEDDTVVQGEVRVGEHFEESDFNRVIEIMQREKYRVELFMNMIDQRQKTLVFCRTQDHALAVRDLINQIAKSKNHDYCARVTANDGSIGETHLKTFQDNEKTIPTILTTSQKLSTGVDARNIRNIVLMRPINSMIEFKQIIGRGTRLYETKAYFTIYDFVKAHEHFRDPEWDGEPIPPDTPDPKPAPPKKPKEPGPGDPEPPDGGPNGETLVIVLGDGSSRELDSMVATSFWHPDGTPMSSKDFLRQLYANLPSFFTDERELRSIWSRPDTRRQLLEGLAEMGYGSEQLAELANLISAEQSDIFDVLLYVAKNVQPITRRQRVESRRPIIMQDYDPKQQEFLDFVLRQYVDLGISELDSEKLPGLIELQYHSIKDAISELGPVNEIRNLFIGFQSSLYSGDSVA